MDIQSNNIIGTYCIQTILLIIPCGPLYGTSQSEPVNPTSQEQLP